MVTITKDGMNIRWEDDSKSLQSSIFLNSEVSISRTICSCWLLIQCLCTCCADQDVTIGSQGWLIDAHRLTDTEEGLISCQVFAEYQVPWERKTFGLHFHNFTDTLTVFASTSTSDLTIRYPGPNEELTFE